MGSQSRERLAIRDETATRLQGISMTAGGLLIRLAARFLGPWKLAILFILISAAAILIDVMEPDWLPGHREAATVFWLLLLLCTAGILESRSLLSLAVLLVKPKSPLLPVAFASGAAVALLTGLPNSDPTWHLHLVLWFMSCYAPVLSRIDSNQWEWTQAATHLTFGSCALNMFLVVPAFPLAVEVWILFVLAALGTVRGVAVTYGLMLIAGSAVTFLMSRADVELAAAGACMALLVSFTIIFTPSLIWIRSRLDRDRWRKRAHLNRIRSGIGPQHFV